ncbi:MAG: SlyX family protein [Arenicella sp.]
MSDKDTIAELQSKMAFLEDALDTLSNEFYAQQQLIERMQAKQQHLIQKISDMGDDVPVVGGDDRPPHY